MKKVFFLALAMLAAPVPDAPCAEDAALDLERIIVTPSRIPAASVAARSVAVIGARRIERSAYTSVQDAIGALGTIDLRRRGPEGVQADIAIRGSTFEESQVLLDGIAVNDPQTGHFNLDVPVTKFDLNKVEIVKGPVSSVTGANAIGGAVSFFTKKPTEDRVVAEASGGSCNFFSGGFSASQVMGRIRNRFSFQEDRSTGYMPDTWFTAITVTEQAYAETPAGDYDFLFGYLKKDFGADSFYSNLYSNEEEHTDTRFFKVHGDAQFGNLAFRPNVFLRRHRDKFALDRDRPGWQTNYHTTYNYGADLPFMLESGWADVAYGFELARESIDSTSMQIHRRTRDGIYAEISPKLSERFSLDIGFREDRYSDFGWQASPSVTAGYSLSEACSLRAFAGRAYRAPTFTDLYYRDAANLGNANLVPEVSWTYEGGVDCRVGPASSRVTVFRRTMEDAIDWTRANSRAVWRAGNVGSVDTNGMEVSLKYDMKREGSPFGGSFFADWTMLDSYYKHGYLSKYTSDYLKQHISSGLSLELPYGLRNEWVLNYKRRVRNSGFLVVDTSISASLPGRGKTSLEIFLDVTNLFDVQYSEQSDIPMPGRWLKSGARMRF